jgi:hypothetical protein
MAQQRSPVVVEENRFDPRDGSLYGRVARLLGEVDLSIWHHLRVPLVVDALSVLEAIEYAEVLEDLGFGLQAEEVIDAIVATCRVARGAWRGELAVA